VKFLLAASLHHPQELATFRATLPPDAPDPLFPPSQGAYFWAKALRAQGHEVAGFIRNTPALFGGGMHMERFKGNRLFARLSGTLNANAPRLNPDYRLRNRRLLDQVARFRPEAFLLSGGNTVIYTETLAAIRRLGTKIVYLSGVSPVVFSNAMERAAAPLYDLVLVNDYYHGIQWLELGAKKMEALPISACDPEFHHPHLLTPEEQGRYACELGFVGTLVPDRLYGDRVEALNAVRDLGLGIWSIHGIPQSLRDQYRGEALGETMLRVLCGSKIQVNPHGTFMRWGGNLRLFEAAACGIFQITDDRPGISRWFTPGKHLVMYRDPAHLRELAMHYLAHPTEREGMARAARDHVLTHHTYDQRMQALVGLLEG